jgi:FkbM family methyltransferase
VPLVESGRLRRASRYLKGVIEARLGRYYAPTGEDAILRYLFDSVRITHPDYLDVGTSDPVNGNNTYVFYRDGSSGVCVEAQPDLARRIAEIRPRDVCLNVAIGVGTEPNADVYVFDAAGLSTIDLEEATRRASHGRYRVIRTVTVPMQTINDVITTNFASYPALLSLDIEGLDLAVLRSLDHVRFPIPVICVETVRYSESHIREKDHAIAELLESRGYFLYADTFINSIFVLDAWYRSQATGRGF